MMRRTMIGIGMLGLLALASCTTTSMMLSAKPEMEQKRDAVECQRDAQQGAGDGFGMIHRIEVNRLLKLCLEGRGWVSHR